jgi:hypothetical protein
MQRFVRDMRAPTCLQRRLTFFKVANEHLRVAGLWVWNRIVDSDLGHI